MTLDESRRDENTLTHAKTPKTVLVVEDNAAIQQLLIFCLDLAHYSCSVVEIRESSPFAWMEETVGLLPTAIIFDMESIRRQSPFKFLHAFCTQWAAFFRSMPIPPLILLTTNTDRANALQREGLYGCDETIQNTGAS